MNNRFEKKESWKIHFLKRIGVCFLFLCLFTVISGIVFRRDDAGKLNVPDWYSNMSYAISIIMAIFYDKIEKIKMKKREMILAKDTFGEVESQQIVPQSPFISESTTIPVMPSNRFHSSIPIRNRNPLDVIKLMEKRFEEQYQFAYKHLFNIQDCQKMYEKTVKEFAEVELPLMAQMRFEQLCVEYKDKFNITNPFILIDEMNGPDFEQWCAELLRKIGFSNVEVTQGSGDQGVDILAEKDEIRYAIQCKCYSSDLGNKPIQEVNTGKVIYCCQIGAVITNRFFTHGAIDAAKATGILLWDRNWIQKKLKEVGELPSDLDVSGTVDEEKRFYNNDKYDELLPAAAKVVAETGMASVSMLQRRMNLGYSRATRLIDQLEEMGYVGPFVGTTPRQVFITSDIWEKHFGNKRAEEQFSEEVFQ